MGSSIRPSASGLRTLNGQPHGVVAVSRVVAVALHQLGASGAGTQLPGQLLALAAEVTHESYRQAGEEDLAFLAQVLTVVVDVAQVLFPGEQGHQHSGIALHGQPDVFAQGVHGAVDRPRPIAALRLGAVLVLLEIAQSDDAIGRVRSKCRSTFERRRQWRRR